MDHEIQEFQSLLKEQHRLKAVKDQIEKDFGLVGFQFEMELNSWEQLIQLLAEGIAQIRAKNDGSWMKIVYRVDLTEKQYRFVKSLGGDTDENLAKAVVLREFQKVITREKYRDRS